MARTLVELVLAPALVAISTLVARRWGSRAGGVVSAFPAIVGPVLLILALARGRSFAAHAANGTLLGLVALSAFALAYGWVAARRGWPTSLVAGWTAAALAALAVGAGAGHAGSPVGLLVATVSLTLAFALLPSTPSGLVRQPRSRGLPLRMASAAFLVTALSTAAGALGAVLGGMLAALPVLACVLVVFTHREQDAPAAIALLRGLLAGMASFVIFCQLIAMLTTPYGIAPAFTLATLAALGLQALTIYPVHSMLRRHSSAPSASVAAAAGSSRRQSS